MAFQLYQSRTGQADPLCPSVADAKNQSSWPVAGAVCEPCISPLPCSGSIPQGFPTFSQTVYLTTNFLTQILANAGTLLPSDDSATITALNCIAATDVYPLTIAGGTAGAPFLISGSSAVPVAGSYANWGYHASCSGGILVPGSSGTIEFDYFVRTGSSSVGFPAIVNMSFSTIGIGFSTYQAIAAYEVPCVYITGNPVSYLKIPNNGTALGGSHNYGPLPNAIYSTIRW